MTRHVTDTLERAPFGVIRTDEDGRVEHANERARTLLGVPDTSLAGEALTEAYPRSAEETLRTAFEQTPVPERSFEEYYPRLERWLTVDIVRADGPVVYLDDVTPTYRREQKLDTLESRLDRLRRMDALVADVLTQVTDATDGDEVAELVCRQLGTTELYAFTWAGERSVGDDGLRLVAAAGEAADLRAELERQLDGSTTLPEEEAVSSGEPVFVDNIASADALPDALRVAAFGSGLQSYGAIPLAGNDVPYGVLCVYSSREDGFSQQERESLRTLGEIAGFAIAAMRRETLLAADTVTRLELRVEDPAVPFDSSAPVSLVGSVQRDDDAAVYYVRTPADDTPTSEEHECVAQVREVESGAESLYEVTVQGQPPLVVARSWGGTVHTAEYTARSVQLTLDLPRRDDLHQFVETLRAEFETVSVRSKAEARYQPATAERFRTALAERLTERQETVLRTAALADYFQSPRGSSAEELADALDVTGPTVLYHLRRAQRKLVDAFFNSQGPQPRDGRD